MADRDKTALIWVIGAFVVALVAGYIYMTMDFSGVLPGDDGEPAGQSVTDNR
jgi:hypothetical protein